MSTTPKRNDKVIHLNRPGRVDRVFATTAQVVWNDGTFSRIPLDRLTITKPARAVEEVKLTPARLARRRFSDVVERGMRDKGLTVDQLAERAGLSKSSITRFMREAPLESDSGRTLGTSIGVVEKIAAALGIAPGDFWEVS